MENRKSMFSEDIQNTSTKSFFNTKAKRAAFYISIIIASVLVYFSCAILFICKTKVTKDNAIRTYVCYITDYGDKYHAGNCQYLHSSKYKTTVYEAKKDGYTPCSKCTPSVRTTYTYTTYSTDYNYVGWIFACFPSSFFFFLFIRTRYSVLCRSKPFELSFRTKLILVGIVLLVIIVAFIPFSIFAKNNSVLFALTRAAKTVFICCAVTAFILCFIFGGLDSVINAKKDFALLLKMVWFSIWNLIFDILCAIIVGAG